MEPTAQPQGIKIINGSLFRMGTKSMALAYQTLGFKTNHGLFDDLFSYPWALMEEAAEATWPSSVNPRAPYTREEWDALWGSYDAVTDLSSPFALELIKAYPDAKVVVVQRNFDSWWTSIDSGVLNPVFPEPMATINSFLLWNILGSRAQHAVKRILLGFFHARTREEIAANARERYDAYFRDLRELVPPERRLEYKLGSGWEPLCTFLGVPVPNVPFPFANEQATLQKDVKSKLAQIYSGATHVVLPWAVGVGAVAGAAWLYSRRG